MAENDGGTDVSGGGPRVTVEASDVEGILDALGIEPVDPDAGEQGADEYPAELAPVLETLADVYAGVETATEQDSRGRSRKMVREYAGREDLSSDDVGFLLRALEIHDLVVQDGNRWRIADADDG